MGSKYCDAHLNLGPRSTAAISYAQTTGLLENVGSPEQVYPFFMEMSINLISSQMIYKHMSLNSLTWFPAYNSADLFG